MARNVRMTHSEHLRDPAVAAEYLNAALEDGDPSVVLWHCATSRKHRKAVLPVSRAALGLDAKACIKCSLHSGNPKLSSFTKLIRSLGLHREVYAGH